MKITLMDFLSGEDRLINVNELTVSDAIYMLKDRVFDQHFDRKKILSFITQLSKDFFTKYYGREFCPRCLSSSVEEIKSYEGVKKSFLCKDCGKKFKHRGVICTHFEDWVIRRIVTGIYHGESVSKIREDLEEEMKSREQEFHVKTKIPDQKSIYGLSSRVAEKLEKITAFLVLVTGGLKCEKIFCDDAFSRKRRKKNRGLQKNLTEAKAFVKRGRKRRDGRYYYVIVVLDADTRFIIVAYVSKARNKKAFSEAFSLAKDKLKSLPRIVRGDKLKSMEVAAEKFFSKSQVQLIFEKLKPYEKGELNKIERRIRDLRNTIGKRRKYGSLRVLKTYVTTAVVATNFLEPMDVLGGKTPAQTIGIPYPLRKVGSWEAFLEWARLFQILFPKILKVGLKKIPGTPLSPSH